MSISKSFKQVWAPLHSWRAIRQTVRVCLLVIHTLSARYLTLMMLFVPVFMRAVMLLLKNDFSSYGILCCETLLECLFCTIHDLEKTEKTNKTNDCFQVPMEEFHKNLHNWQHRWHAIKKHRLENSHKNLTPILSYFGMVSWLEHDIFAKKKKKVLEDEGISQKGFYMVQCHFYVVL